MFLTGYSIFLQKCLILVTLIAAIFALTPVDQCSNNNAQRPIEVDVVNCTQQPCLFKRRTDVIMYMTFKASEHVDQLKATVVAHVGGADVPYPLPQPNACETLVNTHCPLEQNETAKYRLQMHISILYPKITLGLTMSLKPNGKEEDLVCFNMQAKVV